MLLGRGGKVAEVVARSDFEILKVGEMYRPGVGGVNSESGGVNNDGRVLLRRGVCVPGYGQAVFLWREIGGCTKLEVLMFTPSERSVRMLDLELHVFQDGTETVAVPKMSNEVLSVRRGDRVVRLNSVVFGVRGDGGEVFNIATDDLGNAGDLTVRFDAVTKIQGSW